MLWAVAWLALSVEPATICEIAEEPEKYQDKLVSVMAEVVVRFERQTLSDPNCASKPLWFEFAQGRKFPGSRKFESWTKRATAEVIGRVYSGSCFGHNCFGRAQIVVEEFRGIASQHRVPSCEERWVALRAYGFKRGHMDNDGGLILLPDRSRVRLVGMDQASIPLEGIFQIALRRGKIVELKADPNTGLVSLPSMSQGVYPFSAVGLGFQSVSGCIWIRPGTRRVHKLELPVGV